MDMRKYLLILLSIVVGLTSISQSPMKKLVRHVTSVGCVGDADACAYVAANGETDPTFLSDLSTLITTWKGQGNWTQIDGAGFLFVGSYGKVKVNLKQPGIYDLTANGSITYTSTGITWSGSNYLTTGFIPASASGNMNANSSHIAFFRVTNDGGSSGHDMGVWDFSQISLNLSVFNDGNIYTDNHDLGATGGFYSVAWSNSSGLFCVNRTSSTDIELFRNGSSLGTASRTSLGLPNVADIAIGAANSAGAPQFYSTSKMSFYSYGGALPDPSGFYTALQTFLTARGL